MRLRRARLMTVLGPDEICPSVTAFPLMGVGTFTDPSFPPGVRGDACYGGRSTSFCPPAAH